MPGISCLQTKKFFGDSLQAAYTQDSGQDAFLRVYLAEVPLFVPEMGLDR